jgi:hypothetical protein
MSQHVQRNAGRRAVDAFRADARSRLSACSCSAAHPVRSLLQLARESRHPCHPAVRRSHGRHRSPRRPCRHPRHPAATQSHGRHRRSRRPCRHPRHPAATQSHGRHRRPRRPCRHPRHPTATQSHGRHRRPRRPCRHPRHPAATQSRKRPDARPSTAYELGAPPKRPTNRPPTAVGPTRAGACPARVFSALPQFAQRDSAREIHTAAEKLAEGAALLAAARSAAARQQGHAGCERIADQPSRPTSGGSS